MLLNKLVHSVYGRSGVGAVPCHWPFYNTAVSIAHLYRQTLALLRMRMYYNLPGGRLPYKSDGCARRIF